MKSQAQTVHDIITKRLQWHLENSEGKVVEKPAGANELTLLLSCYKSGITIVADGPGEPHPLQMELDEANARIKELEQADENNWPEERA